MIGWLLACGDPELELRVQELERRLEALEARGPVPAAATTEPVTATPAQEQAAADLLRDASEAMKRLEWEAARAKVDEIARAYPNTRSARATVRLKANLDVIGKPEAELAVERWFRGAAEQVPDGPVLLLFFEAWCSHCKRDLPRTLSLAERYGGRLAVVGLTKMTKGATDEQMEALLTELGVTFPVGKERDGAMSLHYGVLGIPAAAVVVGGRVVWRGSPVELDERTLDALLKGG